MHALCFGSAELLESSQCLLLTEVLFSLDYLPFLYWLTNDLAMLD